MALLGEGGGEVHHPGGGYSKCQRVCLPCLKNNKKASYGWSANNHGAGAVGDEV